MTNETKSFVITTSPELMRRIERFLALLHFNSSFGHSAVFAMALDGDGSEKVKVDPIDKRLGREVDLIGSVGYDVEIARDDSYGGLSVDRSKISRWYTGPAANLYVDGEVRKTSPTKYWNYPEKGNVKQGSVQMGLRDTGTSEEANAKIGVPQETGTLDPDDDVLL